MEQIELDFPQEYFDYMMDWSAPWCCNKPEEQPADCYLYYGLKKVGNVVYREYLYTVKWSET